METLLEQKLQSVYSHDICDYIIRNWKRYLDDGFIPWKKSFGDVQVFVDILNSLDSDINFTFDISDSEIPYLNIVIYKGDNSLMCDMYCKPTDTREYLPFDSCHPHHTKANIPLTLARTICTIVEDRE